MTQDQNDLPARLGALVLAVLRECAAGQDDVIVGYSEGMVSIMASHGRTYERAFTVSPADTVFYGLDRCERQALS